MIIFLSGKAAYHIEGKSYYLKPWDILLVNRHAIHKPEIDFSVPYERFVLWIRDDIKSTELLRCFQKAIDRSYNLIRLDSDTQEKLKQLLYELEAALKDEKFGSELLGSALFTQFMVYVNRIFLEKQYIYDAHSYSSDSQIEELLRYINPVSYTHLAIVSSQVNSQELTIGTISRLYSCCNSVCHFQLCI